MPILRLRRRAMLLGLFSILAASALAAADPPPAQELFARKNLVAWCIVPFDSKNRPPEERAAMLERLGFKRFAYDWRAEHVPTFDAEMAALKRHGITLEAFWAPGELNADSRRILELLKRHGIKTSLWVILDLGPDKATGAEQARRVAAAAAKLKPLAQEAAKIGCSVGLYNHGGWFGQPENQVAIIEKLKREGVTNLGIVYNLHHGHEHLDRLAKLLATIKPYLVAVNLNGMDPDGENKGRKILPLGQGSADLDVLRTVRASGFRGPFGILGHTQDDAEQRLRDNLDGLDWLVPQLDGQPAGPKPKPRTPVPAVALAPGEAEQVAALVHEARTSGKFQRGAEVFADARYGCLTCHKVGGAGGTVGPDLTLVGRCLTPEKVVESLLWPQREIHEGYAAHMVATADGQVVQGYKVRESKTELVLRDAKSGEKVILAKTNIDDIKPQGSLMPEGLAAAMTTEQRRDVVRFLTELGKNESATAHLALGHGPASFPYDRAPLRPDDWPSWQTPVNRDRLYDYYQKEAEYFRQQPAVPALLAAFPGMDGGTLGHWGNQNEETWADGRWNETDLGSVLCGGFKGAGVTVAKGVCVRLGERGELAACFNPQTLTYDAVWSGGFVKLSSVRHGFMDGLTLDGTPQQKPEGKAPTAPFVYHGFYRHGKRVVFAYRVSDVEMLDAPWVKDGQFTREVGPVHGHSLASLTRGGPAQWPQEIKTGGTLGRGRPYAVDTIELPFQNPWKALLFGGDHDFLPDGSALLCTIQGDVWRAWGLDESLQNVRWRRVASGLHQALGLVVADGEPYVLGRDQITHLRDLNGDGEYDLYECANNAYATSAAGHDFICGLQRDQDGNFYTVSGPQGLLRMRADENKADVLATGFRNPDGLGLGPDGTILVPASEGEWTPASMVCEIRKGGHYGYGGPKNGQTPDLPLAYLPRGLDNSSGAAVYVSSDRWGPLQGQWIHLSFGAGTSFLLLRESVGGQPQGAVVPLPTEFRSGVHRGRFRPQDGQLYVSGMAGWGTYTSADGCFERVRYTGDSVQLPVAYHARANGALVTFSRPIDSAVAESTKSHFAQVWNYRYSSGYGSPELSPRHPGTPGHDPLEIESAHVLPDGHTLFLEIPELQPVNQLHLHLRVGGEAPVDLFATVHKLGPPFTEFAGYRPTEKTIAAHPILADLAMSAHAVPNPWRGPVRGARAVTIEAGKNLSFSTPLLRVRAGEPIKLTFLNPDVVPHNWALIKPDTLSKVGDLVNKIIAEPDAALRQYIPKSSDVLAYTDIVPPQDQFVIFFHAPKQPGRYPFLCTFPGHWMAMNGVMVVE